MQMNLWYIVPSYSSHTVGIPNKYRKSLPGVGVERGKAKNLSVGMKENYHFGEI